ncbi:MAG: methyltransferase domain-containing protein [Parcubacteria group bacterium]|nr:methyltransferase domain-containing protein [Parcubacteria group bacterium]
MQFKDPERVLDQLVLGHGRTVVDLGAGSGAYTLSAARRVGDTGRVYAVDIQKELLQRIQNVAKRARLHNVDVIWADIEKINGSSIKEETADVVIVSNILFQAEDKKAIARESYRILKNGGRVLVADWSLAGGVLGPSSDFVFPRDEAKQLFENQGFLFERDIDTGAHHYGMVFRKI